LLINAWELTILHLLRQWFTNTCILQTRHSDCHTK